MIRSRGTIQGIEAQGLTSGGLFGIFRVNAPRNVWCQMHAYLTRRPQIMVCVYWILACVILFWVLAVVNRAMGGSLSSWGLLPRTAQGLVGILFGPFLHSGIRHVMINTIPFVVLGGLVITRGPRVFLELSLFIILVSGTALWIFGRSSYHIGASGLIFGYFGFLVARGWYDRSARSIIVALLVICLYGGILWGLLPTFTPVSWEGHLFGLASGIIGARLERPQ